MFLHTSILSLSFWTFHLALSGNYVILQRQTMLNTLGLWLFRKVRKYFPFHFQYPLPKDTDMSVPCRTLGLMCSREINSSPGLYHRWRVNNWCVLCCNQRDSFPPINPRVNRVDGCAGKCVSCNRTQLQPRHVSSTAMLIMLWKLFPQYFLP